MVACNSPVLVALHIGSNFAVSFPSLWAKHYSVIEELFQSLGLCPTKAWGGGGHLLALKILILSCRQRTKSVWGWACRTVSTSLPPTSSQQEYFSFYPLQAKWVCFFSLLCTNGSYQLSVMVTYWALLKFWPSSLHRELLALFFNMAWAKSQHSLELWIRASKSLMLKSSNAWKEALREVMSTLAHLCFSTCTILTMQKFTRTFQFSSL